MFNREKYLMQNGRIYAESKIVTLNCSDLCRQGMWLGWQKHLFKKSFFSGLSPWPGKGMENKQNIKQDFKLMWENKSNKKRCVCRRGGPRNFPRQKLSSSPLAESKNVSQHEALAGHCQQWDSLLGAVGVLRRCFSEFPNILRTTASWTCG